MNKLKKIFNLNTKSYILYYMLILHSYKALN